MTDLEWLRLDRQAERLLAPWNRPDLPGVALGIVRDGALAVHRQAGQASLELGVPIGENTAFRIASVSKQFTCAAVLMLAAEGRLGLEDDLRDHLPEMPDFGHRITVAHLMHNTSGLRDMLELTRLGGMDLSVPARAEDLTDAILRQRTLNFAPGTRFLYSNTNFWLLGQIVEKLAGEKLPAFLNRRIFAPLGMTRTRLTESTAEIAPGLATGYLPRESGGFVRARHNYPLGGEGGLVSSVADLALWDRNLATGRVGGAELAAGLEEQASFPHGALNSYARGMQVQTYRGLRTVDHSGLWPGFKSHFLRVPARGVTVICLSNNGAADAYRLAHRMLDAVFEGDPGFHPVQAPPERGTLERLAGRYLDAESGLTAEFAINQAGEPTGTVNGLPFLLVPDAQGRLVAFRPGFDFAARPDGTGETVSIAAEGGPERAFHRAPANAALPPDLRGRYVGEEAGATWTIAPEADGMAVRVAGPLANAGPWKVEPVGGDCLRVILPGIIAMTWLDVRALRDAAGAIAALSVSAGRSRRVEFRRLGGRAGESAFD